MGSVVQKEGTSVKHFRALLLGAALTIAAAACAQDDAEQAASEGVDLNGFTLELVADGLVSPVTLAAPDGDDRLFIVDRVGQIWIYSQDGERTEEPFLDIADRMVELNEQYDERGLLGFDFHPDFPEDNRIFVYYSAPLRESAPQDWNHTAILSSFEVNEEGTAVDPESETVILEIDQPQMNHNGGQLSFDSDGHLLLGLGDGGGADDVDVGHPPMGNGQDVTTLLGSILRLDVDSEEPYGIPEDNPFAGGVELPADFEWANDEARAEIYLWGLRNPYRFSVDRETGDLLVPDVGQNLWEEVNHVTGPGNLGWNLAEGSSGFDPENPNEILTDPPTTGPMGEELVMPVLEYAHPGVAEDQDLGVEQRGTSITGGYVYRGDANPDLQGYYVFGDWSQSFGSPGGKIFVASTPATEEGEWGFVVDQQLEEFVLAFAEDGHGELYLLTTENAGPSGETGKVYRLVSSGQGE